MKLDINKKKEKIILDVISKILGVKRNMIKLNLKVGDIPAWDSLNHIKIYFELKKRLKKEISFKNLTQVRSVRDWVKLFA
tara:strand:+ start:1237 stop:1476 length:240 start_codon:yes stop_codon:yes gene_type:complete